MDISLGDTDGYFYTGVHPSGYHLGKQPISDSHASYSNYVIPNKPKEILIKKKVSLSEFLIDIESFKNNYPTSENELMMNINFPEKLVNKYGLLEGTSNYWHLCNNVQSHNMDEFMQFMEGKEIKGIPSLLLNDQQFSKNYSDREELDLWIMLLSADFSKKTQRKKQPRLQSARWSRYEDLENKLISKCSARKVLGSNKITLEPNCLGSAYLFFRYSKNITGTKKCNNCEKIFVDASRSNNQKFCSEACKTSAYRERQVKEYKRLIDAKIGLFTESKGKYKYLESNFNDVRKNQIRRLCSKHGEFATKLEMLEEDCGCPKCNIDSV